MTEQEYKQKLERIASLNTVWQPGVLLEDDSQLAIAALKQADKGECTYEKAYHVYQSLR